MRIRTGYSFGHAVGHLADVLESVKRLNLGCAPISDTASTFGWVKWDKLCKKANIRPVFGVELAVSENTGEGRSADQWTFFAKNSLIHINQLVFTATNKFYYFPRLSFQDALEADVIRIAGKLTDPKALGENIDKVYFELSPGISRGQFARVEAAGGRWVAMSDNRYPEAGGFPVYAAVCARPGRTVSRNTYPQHIVSDPEWGNALRWVPEAVKNAALENRAKLLNESQAELAPGKLFPFVSEKSLEELCREGATRLGADLSRPGYEERLRRELDLIREKNFETYFFIIADLCRFARSVMIVGPARGSSCGSLVCYLLGITTVDPIPFELIFERFIDVNRSDLPDIDIDFAEGKRELVFDYMISKYGADHVARLGTVSTFKPRSALIEAGKSLGVPDWKLNPVLDSIIFRSSGDSRAQQQTEDTLTATEAGRSLLFNHPEIMLATKLEAHPRHSSQHAAGMLLTARPVGETVAKDARTKSVMCDKKDAEALNLLKIDALGLTQLSIFERCLELMKVPPEKRWDYLDALPHDDPEAFGVLNKGYFAGIFQFNGFALQSITKQLKEVSSLEDIISITALGRPGPLATGGTNHWVRIRNGEEQPTYPHPLFEPHLKSSLGVVTYQEQVMMIGREIGDLSWGDVTALRQAMSKSLGIEYFDQFGDRWKEGARRKGIPDDILTKVWDDLCAYGSWTFNRSHAVAYGLVSYYCCWLKAHYPLEFAAATLSYTDSLETQIKLLREMMNEGVSYVPVDRKLSEAQWTVKKGKLIGPLSTVVGLGPVMMNEFLDWRSRQTNGKSVVPPVPLSGRIDKLLTNPRTKIDSLWPIRDRIREIGSLEEFGILSAITPIIEVQTNGSKQFGIVVLVLAANIKPRNHNEEVYIAKRGGTRMDPPTDFLNLKIMDDTDEMFATIDRYSFERLGRPIIERGKAGKALYILKGNIPQNFRILQVTRIRYIGDLIDPLGINNYRSDPGHHDTSVTGMEKGKREDDFDNYRSDRHRINP